MEKKSIDVVISGIAGRFPQSDNVKEYEKNLCDGIYLVDDSENRIKWNFPNQPTKFGLMRNLNKFDSQAFRVPSFVSKSLDPQGRVLLEHVIEAILDAGVSPKSLIGSNTGVYVGCFNYDSLDYWMFDKTTRHGVSSVGNAAYAMANRISFAIGAEGPSIAIDTACSSSLTALTIAFNDIQLGNCDCAIVAGTNLILSPLPVEDFSRSGVLTKTGVSQPFDKNASGYVRAEACCAIFLQKSDNAKRIYAKVVNTKANNDGFKKEGPVTPSSEVQKKLYKSVYSNGNELDVDYIEAHATSTQVGDKQEIKSIDDFFCKNRTTPLKVGSVKSNIGHAEGAAGLTSLIKSILMFENGKFYPNINITELRDDCPALVENRIEIVRNVDEFNGRFIGINSFGVNGSNAHALIMKNEKMKIDGGIPCDGLPRLLTWSGRTKEAMDAIFDRIAEKSIDDEFLALLQSSQLESNTSCQMKGFGIFQTNSEDRSTVTIDRQVKELEEMPRPIVFVYSGVGSQWLQMGRDLMKIPFIADKIEECHQVLVEKHVNLKEVLISENPENFANSLNIFIGVAAIQIALTDLMKLIGIIPDYLIGHSVGELGCAYADETLTLKETILAAYSRGIAISSVKREPGAMAAVAMGYKKLKNIIPKGVEIACHNSSESCTVSGGLKSVENFVIELKSKNVLAKVLDTAKVPFHSSYIAESGPLLLNDLKSIIKEPKSRSSKWISTSVAKEECNNNEIAQLSSAEYHANNMLSPVLFEEGATNLPDKSLVIEIAPCGLLQSIVKKCLPNCEYVNVTKRDADDGLVFLLQSLGRIYQHGIDFDIRQIYPKIEYPVSRSTEMISPLIKWNHTETFLVPMYDPMTKCDKRNLFISLSDSKYHFMRGHQLGGRVILPATGYLIMVWETLAMMHCKDMNEFSICFEDVKFMKATILSIENDVELTINIQRGSGYFEIIDGVIAVVSGIVKPSDDTENLREIRLNTSQNDEHSFSLSRDDFYKELRLRGYEYSQDFVAIDRIEKLNEFQIKGKVEWKANWVTFIDCMLQSIIVSYDSRDLFLPIGLRKCIIDPVMHHKIINNATEEKELVLKDDTTHDEKSQEKILLGIQGDHHLNSIRCGGVEIIGLNATFVTKLSQSIQPTFETYKFISHLPTPKLSTSDAARFCIQLLIENFPMLKLNLVEIDSGDEPLIEAFACCLDKIPMVLSDIKYLTKRENIELKNVDLTKDDDLAAFSNLNILIVKNALNNVEKLFEKMDENGFLLSRENEAQHNLELHHDFKCIAIVTLDNELVYIIRKLKNNNISNEKLFEISNENFQWIDTLKNEIKKENLLIATKSNGKFSGILGFFNCLKKETNNKNLRCLFVDDENAPDFNIENNFYRNQLQLGLVMNVFKDGKWGSYRHFDSENTNFKISDAQHSFVNLLNRGEISSLAWVNGHLNAADENLVKVQFTALNYRDVLIATKRIILDYELENRIDRQYLSGYEFSGITKDGRRVMGMCRAKGIANYISLNESLVIDIPPQWTLEEAATVPVVYVTVYLAFFYLTSVEKGKSVLIHAGSGGLGTAAIRVALAYGLKVFTTVSNEEKKKYLLTEFPELEYENIGNSRDTTFETMIMDRTNGKGVDYVLNSLADDKMQASIRCVADNGVFLEIGKFDMLMGTKISLNHFLRGITFKAVLLNLQELMKNEQKARQIFDKMEHDMNLGIIKPLKVTVFNANEVEKAFRFLAASKHMGKVLINVTDHTTNDNMTKEISVLPRLYFDPKKCYIITGGLGGMGMEIADWMILRECKKLVLSSSRGISNSYQTYRMKLWQSYGVKTFISTADITTREGCEQLIKDGMKLGPIGGIFNLAGVVSDGLFEKLNEESFIQVLKPKTFSTIFLDEISRDFCPKLDHFVVFSSVSCGFGNAGQTNYGYANSIIERVVEKRKLDGFPGKAIQWGPVDDVGMVKKMSQGKELTSFFGMIPQKIQSCFEALNYILSCNDTIVTSVVVAEKHKNVGNSRDFFETIMTAMGVPDIKSIDRNKPISTLGIDSIGGTEIQQALEREFGITLTFQELRMKSINEIEALIKGNQSNVQLHNMTSFMDSMWKNLHSGMSHDKLIEELKVVAGKRSKMLLIPGMIASIGPIWQDLDYSIYILQHMKFYYLKSFDELFNAVINEVLELYKDDDEFILVGYSFGSTLALKICETFQALGKHGKLIFIDGSPSSMKAGVKAQVKNSNSEPTDEDLQELIFNELTTRTYGGMANEVLKSISMQSSWKLKVEEFTKLITDEESKEFTRKNLESLINRIRMVINESFNINIIDEDIKVVLIKPDEVASNFSDDYGLNEHYKGEIRIETIQGDHYTIIDNHEILNIINSL